jgi:enoyl-CoA hydratase
LRLPQRIAPQIAMELALTGDMLPATEARHWGLVNRLVPAGQALQAALDLAGRIAANAPMAVRVAKQVVRPSPDWPADERWARQNALLEQVITSEDAREGALAFAEKRAPRWSGR